MTMLQENGIQLRIVEGNLAVNKRKNAQIPPPLLLALKEKKEEIIYLLRHKQRYQQFSAIEPVEEKEFYTVSSPQRRLFVLQQLQPANLSYNSTQTIILPDHLDVARVEEAFNVLGLRHESLRTSFLMVGGEPVQRIHKVARIEVETFGHAGSGGAVRPDDVIRGFVRPFDLERPPLIRVGVLFVDKLRSILLVDFHHIIADGASLSVLGREFTSLYAGQRLKPLTLQYRDYSQWLNNYRESSEYKRQRDYWRGEFSTGLPVLNLPTDFPRPRTQEFGGKVVGFAVSEMATADLNRLARECGATMFILILSVFNVLLSRLSGQEDIVVGTPVAARRHTDLDSIIGMFVNTLALRNFPRGDMKFGDFLEEVKGRSIPAFENQEFQFADLVDTVAVNRDTARNPLFDVMFNLLNQMEYRLQVDIEDLRRDGFLHRDGTAKFDLNLTAIEVKQGLYFDLEYSTRLFTPQTIERFISYFSVLFRTLCGDPGLVIGHVDMMAEAEKDLLLHTFNATNVDDYPLNTTVHQLFSRQTSRTPDKVALTTGPAGAGHMTYSFLDRQAGILAAELRENGVGPGTVSALMMERSLSMMVAIFGILKSGACYLPVDPKYPEKRIRFMLEDSRTALLLCRVGHAGLNVKTLWLEEGAPLPEPPDPNVETVEGSSSSPAYAIYTSGSTGRPKGVLVEHGSIINRLWWVQDAYAPEAGDVWLQKTTITFDVSVVELFWWSLFGGRLVLLEPGGEMEPGLIVDTLRRENVSLVHFVPSMLGVFMDYVSSMKETAAFPLLRQVFCSGEELLPSHVEAFYDVLTAGGNSVRLANLYGPTEACVDVSFFDCPEDFEGHMVPIGMPISNIRLHILDKYRAPVPLGVAGELYIAGIGVARGYLNRPELTHERFVNVTSLAGERMYGTGDLCRRHEDGSIEFLGRLDQQVKVRGFRIELGEIENVLIRIAHISQASVIPVGDGQDSGQTHLCACVVSSGQLDSAVIKQHLARHLPDYMVPSYVVEVEEIPLTPSGKVDRWALRNIGFLPERSGAGYRPPSTRLESKLLEIWAGVLNIDAALIGMDNRFFDLGGHSLSAIQVVAAANRLHFDISLGDMFEHQTIATLADFISRTQTTTGVLAGAADDFAVDVSVGIPSNPGFEPDVYATYFPCSYGAIREKIRYEYDVDIPKGLFLSANGHPIPALGYRSGDGIQRKTSFLHVDYPKLLGFREVGEVIGFSTQRRRFPSLGEAMEYCRREIGRDHVVIVTGTTYFLNYTPDYRVDRETWLNKMDGILQTYNDSQKGKLLGHVFLLVDIGKEKYLLCDCTYNYFGVVSPEDFALAFQGNGAIEMSRGHKSFTAYPSFQVVELDVHLPDQQTLENNLLNACREIVDISLRSRVLRSNERDGEYVAYLGLNSLEELGRIIGECVTVPGQLEHLQYYCREMTNTLKYKYIFLRDILLDVAPSVSLPDRIVNHIEEAIGEWDSHYRALERETGLQEPLVRLKERLVRLHREHLLLFKDIDAALGSGGLQ
jgi:amino acid adenylation domain-containing protein